MNGNSGYTKPLPTIDERNRHHWEGARDGHLMVQQCLDCGAFRYPAARMCPHCQSERQHWTGMSGRGTVWSWCVFHRPYFKGFEPDIPYLVVLVKLDEGPKFYSNLVGVPRESVRIGMRVRACYDKVTDQVTLVKFEEER
jgi:uncharacterized OB-fold protein